MIAMNKKILI